MHVVTQFPHNIVEDPDMGIVLPDGCRLSARVWMPDDAVKNPVPVILEYIPYRKRDGTVSRDEVMHKYFAGRGYAVARVDMRGNGESQGVMLDEYTQSELQDGADVIAWLAAQDWCSGAVGMMGKSWGGFNCLQVATLQPPALKAVLSVCSTVDRYADDIHYKGGCLLNDNFGWASQMWSYSSRPPDPALVGDKWREMWMERLEAEPFLASDWLAHQRRDAYWRHGSVCEDYSAIQVPVLSIGGWADGYMNTVSHLIENLDVPVKGIVGPWVHQYPHQADPAPRIGFLAEALRWWDKWLQGIETGVEDDPAYRTYLQSSTAPDRARKSREGSWIAEEVWPSPAVSMTDYSLSSGGRLGGDPDALDIAVNSPLDCGLGCGTYFPMSGDVPQMPGDQRSDDARSACFDMVITKSPLTLVGTPVLSLRIRVDKPVAQLAVRLCSVEPDGASTRLSYGMLNLCHLNGHDAPNKLEPGKVYSLRLTLDQMAEKILPGRKLRLAISTAYWPFLWPVAARATVTLVDGHLSLPVHSGPVDLARPFDEAEGATPWDCEVLRPADYRRGITQDLTSGEVTINVVDDHGLNKDAEHGLISGSITRETWTTHPDDPLCTSANTHWTQENARGDWSVRTETYARMWSDAEDFHLEARLEAFEGDKLVFEKTLRDKIPRDHM